MHVLDLEVLGQSVITLSYPAKWTVKTCFELDIYAAAASFPFIQPIK